MIRTLFRMIEKDLRRHARDPLQIALWAAIPLAIAILMKLAFGGGGTPEVHVRLAIADQDRSLVSQLVRGAFSNGQLADLYETTIVDSAEARELVADGKVSAALFIPQGFGDDYLRGRETHLSLVENPAEQILPRIAEETLEFLADGGSVLRSVLDSPIDLILGTIEENREPADSTVLSISSTVHGSLERISASLFPPVLALVDGEGAGARLAAADLAVAGRTSEDLGSDGSVPEGGGFEEDSPSAAAGSAAIGSATGSATATKDVDYFALFFPGIVLMAMLFIGQALASDLWEEHKLATFERTVVSSDGVGAWVLAKTLSGTILFLVVFELLFLVGRYALRLEMNSIHLASLYLGFVGFAFLAGLEWLSVAAKTENGGSLLMNLVVMPLILLGGSLFPLESMPPFLRTIGEWTPNGRALGVVKGILFGTATGPSVLGSAAFCLALGFVFVTLASRQSRRRFLGE
ncbi:MAG: ABC transporter permease [Candidatus Eisenbacteria bacterium]|nr:ABC transporter permease [Candidatus Eisenbacteria bacterium]